MFSKRKKALLIIIALSILSLASISLYSLNLVDKSSSLVDSSLASALNPVLSSEYVGNQTCVSCHAKEHELWQGSHHDKAMQHANSKTVLADFNNSEFNYNGITSRFSQIENEYFVTTDGPDGQLQQYKIEYTFGFDPLQQYLIALPGGRLQALGIAWDSRDQSLGGQRWYHLYPDENITHESRLHWTKPDQNWNFMCADCHTTNLEKNYDQKTAEYDTHWSEMNVACEACHGPASVHVGWAKKEAGYQQVDSISKGLTINLDERKGISWLASLEEYTATRSEPRVSQKEIEVCARCHSRRSILKENFIPGDAFMDHYQPSLLTEFLYHSDGQIKDEVFVYGSFIQSKMFHQGVTCSDCHEPHSLKLRAEGNGVCLQCHRADKFDQPSHHFHKNGQQGAQCAECHMPQTTYMGVDGRHDHSIRIPRPDLSLTINTPNACTNCHENETAQWASDKVVAWYGEDWSPGWHFGETLYEQQAGVSGIGQDLAAIAASDKFPAIARASAAALLPSAPGPLTLVVVRSLVKDKEAMVRLAALQTIATLNGPQQLQLAMPLLRDPILMVRIEAARILASIPKEHVSTSQTKQLNRVLGEYRAAQIVNADRPEAQVNLGLLALSLGDFDQAEAAYKQALILDPSFVNAYINLADLYRLIRQSMKAERILHQALLKTIDHGVIYHSLGLHYIRNGQNINALTALEKAYQLEPVNNRYAYVYAVALKEKGNINEALTILLKAHERNATDLDVLFALATYYLIGNNYQIANVFAQKLVDINPQFGTPEQLIQQLESGQ
ncbi:MAG: ammonia-forming cytochrome c nitrite reductase subunit c552 [Oleispira sp.]|nr:ammonia-forming cytochrome c nitrite reductase subunit c552 [Oleispira sp.]